MSSFYGLIILVEASIAICLLHWNEAEAQERLAQKNML
jgi:hypothetical protein